MKRGGPEHPKIKMLATTLKINHAQAVGIMEMLYHATARHAPQGNIGKWPDEFIASAVAWDGKPIEVVDAMVRCRLLDRHEQHRLLVHDWHEHADDSTKKTLTRSRQPFLSGHVQTLSGNVQTSPDKASTVKARLGLDRQGKAESGDENSKLTPALTPESEEGAGETNGDPVYVMLADAGFKPTNALNMAAHPNATPERVRWLIDEASKAKDRLKDPMAFIAAGIRSGSVPQQASDFKPAQPRHQRLIAGVEPS
jgi:hypothetical protein